LALVLALAVSCARGPQAETKEEEVARISAEDVKARLTEGQIITFVDARSASAWAAAVAEIPGAVRVPPDDIAANISKVPRGNPVVVYCT
jgi:rhodanese-related sulfurtransferase